MNRGLASRWYLISMCRLYTCARNITSRFFYDVGARWLAKQRNATCFENCFFIKRFSFICPLCESFPLVAYRDVVLTKRRGNAPKKLAILNSFKAIWNQNRKKMWEHSSNASPPLHPWLHVTWGGNQACFEIGICECSWRRSGVARLIAAWGPP